MTTLDEGAKAANQMIRWFFTSDDSRYELAELTRITGASKNDIQNWVRRDMVSPAEVTPGRRIYDPLTVADIKVATALLDTNIETGRAFGAARVLNIVTLSWYGKRDWKDGAPWPAFNRDIRHQFAAFWNRPRKLDDHPGLMHPAIVGRDDLAEYLWNCAPFPNVVVPIGRIWIDLADEAQHLKQRPRKRVE